MANSLTVAVGLETGEALEHAVAGLGEIREERDDRIATVGAETEALREEVAELAGVTEALRERLGLAAHEDRIARLESSQGSRAVADD